MAATQPVQALSVLQTFATAVTTKFTSLVPGQPEDQLKSPVETLLKDFGTLLGLVVTAKTESGVSDVGRPDFGVGVGGLLTGHIELKAPGMGANPNRFTGRDKEQWQRFKALPNLIYTDGNEWALYRSGIRVPPIVRSQGDVTTGGAAAVSSADASSLLQLLTDFYSWKPIVPSTPEQLADVLAPVCRMLRSAVLDALGVAGSALGQLKLDWQNYLFPHADDEQFADAYAQTLIYALLLAHFEGLATVDTGSAPQTLMPRHELLAEVLHVLTTRSARQEIESPVSLIERLVTAVDVSRLNKAGDPWIYFYEHFLAAYDAKLRRDRGVYYTPAEVVHAQVYLVAELLKTKFGKRLGFAESNVVTLDPAAGTGAYPLAVIENGIAESQMLLGPGAEPGAATTLAQNVHAFEILVGPYAVAQLRISERIIAHGGVLPPDGAHVYLNDTLQSPTAVLPGGLPLLYRPLTTELNRALNVKRSKRVLVCLGNPPYDREERDDPDNTAERKGGWVRFGVPEEGQAGILDDFLAPARAAGYGVHLKNLYNDYVYFWRWALWKVFESTQGPGVVSFITAASYVRGPGFVGMREWMRRTFDELWIIDLEGDNRGPRKTANVFNIQTPVAIAVGVRYGNPNNASPAVVHYGRIQGDRDDKLRSLRQINGFAYIQWQPALNGWQDPFFPAGATDYHKWPMLADLFPWQISGAQIKRTWPIGETQDVLRARWQALMASNQRAPLFRETRDRKVSKRYKPLPGQPQGVELVREPSNAACPPIVRYGHRALDRKWIIADSRLADFSRPVLWSIQSDQQIFMSTMFETALGTGASAIVSPYIPDLHHYFGSFGGADTIPLWRDAAATVANVTGGLVQALSGILGAGITAEDIFAYCYAILVNPRFSAAFWEELGFFAPRIPITRSAALFQRGAALGKELLFLHTFALRFTGNRVVGIVPQGQARCVTAVSPTVAGYPESYEYDPASMTLTVGAGKFAPVSECVWGFNTSGWPVLESWLKYRMRQGWGNTSSQLDSIRPNSWSTAMTNELLELIWVLEATCGLLPSLSSLLDDVLSNDIVLASELPFPSEDERKAPTAPGAALEFDLS